MTRRSVPAPAAIPVRIAKLARLLVHLLRGLLIVWLRYPRLSLAQRDRQLVHWSKQLLRILGVRVRCHNEPDERPHRCMLVANHISWLDIFAIDAVLPATFVAKSEIRDWPLVGTLVARAGTLFIERGRRAHARQTNHRIVESLADGRLIAICPEGTTTLGRSLNKFHAALLQPAIDAGATLLPVALRYNDGTGVQTDAAAYVGDTSLVESIWAIATERVIEVELRFAPPIAAAGATRRELADIAASAIALQLGVAPPHKTPERSGDPPAAPPSADRPIHSRYPAPAD